MFRLFFRYVFLYVFLINVLIFRLLILSVTLSALGLISESLRQLGRNFSDTTMIFLNSLPKLALSLHYKSELYFQIALQRLYGGGTGRTRQTGVEKERDKEKATEMEEDVTVTL